MLIFNINSKPPTTEILQNIAEVNRKPLQYTWLPVVGAAVGMACGVLSNINFINTSNFDKANWIGLLAGLLIVGFSVRQAFIVKNARLRLDDLAALSPDQCVELAEVIKAAQCETLDTYREKIIEQKRDFTQGELQAIKKYADEYARTQDIKKKRDALYT